MEYAKLNLKEWQKVKNDAKALWLKEVGKRPTRRTVGKKVDGVRLDIIQVIALLLLLAIILFTGFKAVLHAIPVADSMYAALANGANLHEYPFVPSKQLFVTSMQVLFFIMSELGLIYFVILSTRILRQPVPTRSEKTGKVAYAGQIAVHYLSIRNLTSNLPTVATFGIAAFVVYISAAGLEGNALDKFLPIIMGLILSLFVEEMAEKQIVRQKEVSRLLELEQSAYDSRVRNMEQDPDYLRILSDVIWENLIDLTRMHRTEKKKYHPNGYLESATEEVRSSICVAEYRRNSVNANFASAVRQTATEVKAEAAADQTGLRKPPNGAQWSAKELWSDLERIKAPEPFTRAELRRLYDKGYGAQAAWDEIAEQWNN